MNWLIIVILVVGMVGGGLPLATPDFADAAITCRVNYAVLKGGIRPGADPRLVAERYRKAGAWSCLPAEIRANVANWRWMRPDHRIRLEPGPGLGSLIVTERGRTIEAWSLALFLGKDRWGREWWTNPDCTNVGWEPPFRAQKPVVKPTAVPRQVVVQQQVTVIGDCNNVSVNGQNVTQTTNCQPAPQPTPEASPVPPPPPPPQPTPRAELFPVQVDVQAKRWPDLTARQIRVRFILNGVSDQTSVSGRVFYVKAQGQTAGFPAGELVLEFVLPAGAGVLGAAIYTPSLRAGCPHGVWAPTGAPRVEVAGQTVRVTAPHAGPTRITVELGWGVPPHAEPPRFGPTGCRGPTPPVGSGI